MWCLHHHKQQFSCLTHDDTKYQAKIWWNATQNHNMQDCIRIYIHYAYLMLFDQNSRIHEVLYFYDFIFFRKRRTTNCGIWYGTLKKCCFFFKKKKSYKNVKVNIRVVEQRYIFIYAWESSLKKFLSFNAYFMQNKCPGGTYCHVIHMCNKEQKKKIGILDTCLLFLYVYFYS